LSGFPGRIYKLTLEGKLLGNAGAVRQEAEAVRLDSRNGLSRAERAFCRRASELAGAETVASGVAAELDWTEPRRHRERGKARSELLIRGRAAGACRG
jgi:hypothetical protein